MKKMYALLTAVLCVLCMAGCGALPEDVSASTGATSTLTPTLKLTPAETAFPSPARTPSAAHTPFPTIARTPEPTPEVWEEARFSVDLDGDGEEETIIVNSNINEYDRDDISLGVRSQNEYNEIPVENAYFQSAFITSTKTGDVCVLISIDYGSEDYETMIYSFDNREPVLQGTVGAYVYDVNGTEVTMKDMVDVIGSWDYSCSFLLTDGFTLECLSDMRIEKNWRDPLLTIRELPVEMLEGDTYIAGMVPAGTTVIPVSTDGASYLCFDLNDGSTGRIIFTCEDYEFYINGISEYEYFEHIEYSD